ncbi:hypothetical protein MWH28_03355 [Natroniella sulfidigena]|uniref:hypothetical protein n=1 Tax=Natroniella sulfidigena TaxID=723921 RepID=UPI00200B626F|nr:hypothetical protein [Natroniella sulfidigena]MCK8816402.1 hypothetical protein [Natroniella sulfidigena]
MDYSTKELVIISITVALMVVVGFIFYALANFLLFPGYRFIILGAFLGFMITIPILKIRKVGVITVTSIVFAMIMSLISIFMGLAIVMTALATELTAFLLFRDYTTKHKIIFSAAFYPFYGAIIFVFISSLLIGKNIYDLIGSPTLFLISLVIVYGLGLLGSSASLNTIGKRLR